MTDEFIIKIIKKHVPDLKQIIVEENDFYFYMEYVHYAIVHSEFIPKSKTRRALELARWLPVGVYNV